MKSMLKITMLLALVVAIVACTQVFAADEPTAPAPPPPARERTAGAAPAMGGGGGFRGMGGFGAPAIWQLVQRLELDEAQKTKVADLQKANMEKVQAGRMNMMTAVGKINELPLTGGSEADIKATADEIGKAYAEQAMLQVAAIKDVKALLTAEQNTKLDELIKESLAQAAARRNEMRGQQQEARREVRDRAKEGRPVPPPAPAPQN